MKHKLKFDLEENSIVFGNNKEWLPYIPSNSIDLIYIDPPFFSKRQNGIIWGNGYENRSFENRRKGGILHYIGWMRERIIEAKRVLKNTGSIFLHCDWNASHRLRVMLDEVFGEDNFINELIWCYKSGGASTKRFSRKHDTIFWYGKTKNYVFNLEKEKSYRNESGSPIGRQQYFYDEGGKYTLVSPKDWFEIPMLSVTGKERIGYPTQKPEKLLEKIISCSTKENDLVLDFFGGGVQRPLSVVN